MAPKIYNGTLQRWLTRRPVGLTDLEISAEGRQQQRKPFGPGDALGGRPAVARKHLGQLAIAEQIQTAQGSRQVRGAAGFDDDSLRCA